MADGKPGDHPVTDIVIHGRRVFTPEMDELITDIDAFTADYGKFNPFGEELSNSLLRAEHNEAVWPELAERLRARLAELRSA